jgi:hypothetical protein
VDAVHAFSNFECGLIRVTEIWRMLNERAHDRLSSQRRDCNLGEQIPDGGLKLLRIVIPMSIDLP